MWLKNKSLKEEEYLKVKYIGRNFEVKSLTNGKIYGCIGIEDGMPRIIDDSGKGYLYSAIEPSALENPKLCGK